MGVGYGKLLLFGEHAAVYGYPAVGVRLDRTIELSVGYDEKAKTAEQVLLAQLPGASAQQLVAAMVSLPELLHTHYPDAARTLPETRPYLTDITGTLPMSLGFGSSAAFCTGVIRTLLPNVATKDPDRFWLAAHQLEHTFHGRPSGIDTALAAFPGPSLIRPQTSGMPARSACRLPNATLVVGAVRREKTTADLIAGLGKLREASRSQTQARIERLGALAEASIDLPDARAFGAQADRAQRELAALELSSEELETALSVLRDTGALGAKLSGAGGGGAFFGVFDNHENAETAADALRRSAAVLFSEIMTVGTDSSV